VTGRGEEHRVPDEDLRARNRRAVERYLRTDIEHRLERYRLYTEDGTHALWLTDVGHPIVVKGHDDLRRHGEQSVQVLPDWRWRDVRIIETVDPGQIWVECRGAGTIRFPGYPQGHYDNHFLLCFDLVDGLIRGSREFSNPIEQMRALSIDVPRIERGWIPAQRTDVAAAVPARGHG
jgi:hypothetical protein